MGQRPPYETYIPREIRKRLRLRKLRRIHELKIKMEAEQEKLIPTVGSDRGPGVDGVPLTVHYDDRGPSDAVISGPLGFDVDSGEKVRGIGRWFGTWYEAWDWALEKYGERVSMLSPSLEEGNTRWAVLVKNLRK